MRAVIQRVSRASVTVEGRISGQIGPGLLVLVGVRKGDSEKDADYLAGKIPVLRLFEDSENRANLSVIDTGGSILAVSQFTVYANCTKGRRPAFDDAAPPETARALYAYFVEKLRESGVPVAEGVFQAHMQVDLTNQGPFTVLLDSP